MLITRSNRSAQDRQWLETQEHPGTVVDWFGIDWLDGSIAGREDLISYLEGPDYKLLRRAAELGLETAAAADGVSLVERFQALKSRSHDITPYWRWDTNLTGDGLVMTLRAKTTDAATADPIMLKPTFSFPQDDSLAAGYQDSLDRALRFGGDVEIPHPYLVDFEVETSSEATRRLVGTSGEPGRLRFVSERDTTGLPMLVDLISVTPSGKRSSLKVEMTYRVGGSDGWTLHGHDTTRVLEIAMQMPHEQTGDGSLTLTLQQVTGRFAHQVSPTLEWIVGRGDHDTFEIVSGGHRLATFSAGPAWDKDLTHLARLVNLLEDLEEHAGRPIRIPEQIDTADLVEIEAVCRALSGQRSRINRQGLSISIAAGRLRSFLDAVPDQAGALYISHAMAWQIGDDTVTIDGVATWCSGAQLGNRAELEAVSVDVADHIAVFQTVDDHDVAFIKAVRDPGEPWRGVPT